jgi:hypothetical protein
VAFGVGAGTRLGDPKHPLGHVRANPLPISRGSLHRVSDGAEGEKVGVGHTGLLLFNASNLALDLPRVKWVGKIILDYFTNSGRGRSTATREATAIKAKSTPSTRLTPTQADYPAFSFCDIADDHTVTLHGFPSDVAATAIESHIWVDVHDQ